jgi:hypothetical protein
MAGGKQNTPLSLFHRNQTQTRGFKTLKKKTLTRAGGSESHHNRKRSILNRLKRKKDLDMICHRKDICDILLK